MEGAIPDAALRLLLEDSAEDLYEHAPCGYLSVLLDGTIVKVNETFLTWTGHARADLVGRRRFPDLLTVGGRIFYETHLAPMLRLQGGVREIALDLLHADGRPLPVLVNSRVRTDDDGLPVLVRIMVLDARERTAYERELLFARQAAERSEARVRELQQVTAELAAAPGVAEASAVVARAGDRVFGATRTELWLLHPETGEILPGGAVPPDGPGASGPSRLLAETLRQGEPVFAGPPEFVADLVSQVLLPLAVDHGHVGVLRLELSPPRSVPAAERTALVTLAGQCALALSRAQLHEQTVLAATRSGFLARLGRDLQEVPGVGGRAERLAELAVEETADCAVVLSPEPGGWRAVAVRRRGGPVPADRDAVQDGPGLDSGVVPDEWAEAATRAAETECPQALGRPDGGAAGVAGSCVVLPLRARGRALGALVLNRAFEPFWTSELLFLVDVAERGGLALENARLYEREHGVASTLQRSLLPDRLPTEPRVDLAAHYRPAVEGLDVGGDWYDAFEVVPGVLAIAVGDVVGRGIGAASAMGQLRSAVRALATDGAGPARLIERLDQFVEQVAAARMATLAYAELDLATGALRYASAGHPPLVVVEAGRPGRFEWGGRSAPLGARARSGPRPELALLLQPGARLFLYTDGLVERRRRPLADGLAHLLAQVEAYRDAPLPGLPAVITDVLMEDAVGVDDVCLLGVGHRVLGPLELRLPAALERVWTARGELRRWLEGGGVAEDDVHALVLATSEVLANAIQHGCRGVPDAVVVLSAWERGGEIEVRVTDPGPWPEARAAGRNPLAAPQSHPRALGAHRAEDEGDRGRGLFLLRQLADSVGVERDAGTVVVFRRRVRGRSA
ncbi:MAG: SpoIIE family protein phosphatase [Actinomycetota bacterium]|nr:SpoIIE family protein phosphatase [Actinomycetota bacterium]